MTTPIEAEILSQSTKCKKCFNPPVLPFKEMRALEIYVLQGICEKCQKEGKKE